MVPFLNLEEHKRQSNYYAYTNEKTLGLVLGGKLGGIYSLDSNNDIEFGVKADKTWFRKIYQTDNVKQTKYGIYAGYTYKF